MNTFKLINAEGQENLCKFHVLPKEGRVDFCDHARLLLALYMLNHPAFGTVHVTSSCFPHTSACVTGCSQEHSVPLQCLILRHHTGCLWASLHGAGAKFLTNEEAQSVGELNMRHSHATHDLYNRIRDGNPPEWTWYVQTMPVSADPAEVGFDPLDDTKVTSRPLFLQFFKKCYIHAIYMQGVPCRGHVHNTMQVGVAECRKADLV